MLALERRLLGNDWVFGTDRTVAGTSRVDEALAHLVESVEARDELTARLQEEFDQELLEAAMTQVRDRVEQRTWDAFRLTAMEGQSGAAAAEQLGMEVAAVFKAKSRVQKMIGEEITKLEAG